MTKEKEAAVKITAADINKTLEASRKERDAKAQRLRDLNAASEKAYREDLEKRYTKIEQNRLKNRKAAEAAAKKAFDARNKKNAKILEEAQAKLDAEFNELVKEINANTDENQVVIHVTKPLMGKFRLPYSAGMVVIMEKKQAEEVEAAKCGKILTGEDDKSGDKDPKGDKDPNGDQ